MSIGCYPIGCYPIGTSAEFLFSLDVSVDLDGLSAACLAGFVRGRGASSVTPTAIFPGLSADLKEFLELMPATVSIYPFASRDSYGKPAYGSPTNYRARVLYKPVKVRAPDGQTIVARGVVWLAGTPVLSPQDKMILPDGSEPPILAIDMVPDENGPHHDKIYFG